MLLRLIDTVIGSNYTKVLPLEKQEDFGRYRTKWCEFIQVGNAIRVFQETFEDFEPENVKDMLERNEIQKGELLWEGGSGLFRSGD